jgi:adenosylcobinamide-GDP ribazoletransferase
MPEFYLGVKFSLSYFSNLPIPFKPTDDLSTKRVLGSMLFFLPFVGLILGLFTTLLFLILSKLGWYGAVISAVFYMILYGFIHTEAVIDTVDAIYAKHSNKDAYIVIKEPTVGAMGVLYATGFLIIKVAGIVYLLNHNLFREFISILLISRLSLILLIDTLDFKSSFVTQIKESFGWQYLISSFILSIIIGTILTPSFIVIMLFGVVSSMGISVYIGRKLGFINGDVLGFTLESVEILLFLIIALYF